MSIFSRLLFYTQVLSLDICIGAIGSGALAATLLCAPMRAIWWLLLPASVWVIYSVDHLLDAKKISTGAVNVRHKFHRDHFTAIAIVTTIVGVCCVASAIWFLPDMVLKAGAIISALVAFHLGMAFWGKVRIGKEISVALIYACGVWFGPYLRSECAFSAIPAIAFVLFVIAALLNLFMSSAIEYDLDKKEGLTFATDIISPQTIRRSVTVVSLVTSFGALALAAFAAYRSLPTRQIVALTMLFVLCAVPGVILYYEDYFKIKQRYRALAEWAFALGILLILE